MLGWIIKQMRDWPEIKRLFKSMKNGSKTLVQGITGIQKPLLLAALWPELTGSLLLVTHSPSEAERLFLDLQGLINPCELSFFPAYDLLAHEEAYEEEVIGARLSVLSKLVKNQRQLVVTSWSALSRRLIPPDVFRLYLQSLEVGQEAPRGILFANLVRMGFERTEKIYTFGQFSVRGDIKKGKK